MPQKLIEKELTLDDCPQLSGDERQELEELLAPAVKEISFGPENREGYYEEGSGPL